MNGCNGCLMYENYKGCTIRIRDYSNCPCQTCLIKMVCETACEEMKSHRHKQMKGL